MAVGKTYDQLDERLGRWIADQRMFFVATAPSGPGGHVNLSPKGHADTLAILDQRTVAYLDLTGSGAETIAHLRDNGRITLIFCAFADPQRSCACTGTAGSSCPDKRHGTSSRPGSRPAAGPRP
jgi:hypothetical protein